ncbi:MAG TPA: hypothetical protein EYP52_08125 [Anaerolineae bacterium]|nr:hypothetical protein [Anaerolineae bacterium]
MVEERRAIEVLAAHADRLNDPSAPSPDLSLEEMVYLGPLMEVAERVKKTLVPVEPPAAFVQSLRKELIEAARRRRSATQRLHRGLVIGAAALGSMLSLAGVVALILLHRRGRLRPQPSAGPAGVHP